MIVSGFRSGLIPEIDVGELLPRNISVLGLDWGNYFLYQPSLVRSANEHLQRLYLGDLIQPVIGQTFPLSRLTDALERVESGRELGKLLVTLDETDA